MTRRWTINGRFLTQPLTGVQRYAHEIVAGLDGLVRDRHPLADGLDLELVMPKVDLNYNLAAIPVRRVGDLKGHLWEQLVLPTEARDGVLSLCNIGPLLVRKQILCIHDVNVRAYPQSYTRQYRLLHRLFAPHIANRATRLVTVSAYSALELARAGIGSFEATTIAPNGHEHALAWRPCHSKVTREVAGPNTIVAVGSRAPHKNIDMLCHLAPRLAAAGFHLAIVGGANTKVFRSATDTTKDANITLLGRLTDNELAALLLDSFCLAFPSFVEGFGLPPLEAMAIGCPVIVSDRASLPELCRDAAIYASPDQPEAWIEAFDRLRAQAGLRNQMVEMGRVRARQFRWFDSAQSYLKNMAIADGLLSLAEADGS